MAIDLTKPIILGGVTKVEITPFTDSEGLTPGSEVYDLTKIVADSTSITQDDNTINATDNEVSDEPLFENVVLGRYTFATTSGDIQDDILTGLFGFKKVTVEGKDAYCAPNTYSPKWAKVRVVFGTLGALVCPRVKLSPKITASTLKTGIVQGEISGTCYAGKVGTGSDMTPFYVETAAQGRGA